MTYKTLAFKWIYALVIGVGLTLGVGDGGTAEAAEVKKAYNKVEMLLVSPKSVMGEPLFYPGGAPADIKAAVVTIDPGGETQWHKHGVPLFVYILSGEVTVDYGDQGQRTFGPDAAFMEAMDYRHKGTNLGDEPVRILAVYMGGPGGQNVIKTP